ncbi:MAG: hypothetical protein U0264_00790 [Candidatus Kapaibacterium sp.]
MKKIIYLFVILLATSISYSQTQSLPKMKFSSILLSAPSQQIVPKPKYIIDSLTNHVDSIYYVNDTLYVQQLDTTLTTITFTVNYADNPYEELWNSGPLSAANVNFLAGKYSYDIGPVHGNLQRPLKLIINADGVISERSWHTVNSNDFRVPIGTIQAYMGSGSYLTTLERNGWYLCDGRSISSLDSLNSSEKNALIALLNSGGNPNPNNLPDMRGYFLRGADNGTGNDPDNGSRGGSGAKLGSIQANSVQSHNHTIAADPAPGAGTSVATSAGNTTTVTTNASGGNETRPMNIYVNWIIKAK